MAETTGTRLTRIESKLDKLADAMVSLARAEEKIGSLQEDHNKQYDRINKLSIKIDDIERIVLDNQRSVQFMHKLFWVVVVAAAGAIQTYGCEVKMTQVNEISKRVLGRYLKKTPASSASAGSKMAGQGMNPKASMQRGVKDMVKRKKGVSTAVDKMLGKARVPATESFIIPEEIPANERTAFHGAAAAAAKAGKKSFSFGGKTHPVTMKKDTANKIADAKESSHDKETEMDPEDKKEKLKKKSAKSNNGETAVANPTMGTAKKGAEMEQKESTIRDKLIAVLEGDRSSHYKSATEPETMDDKLKGAGAKKMKDDVEKGMTPNDTLKKAFADVAKAGRVGPAMKARPNDKKDGDKKMQVPDDITKKAGMKEETRDQLAGIKAAYASMRGEPNDQTA